jgi:hypothetical protein
MSQYQRYREQIDACRPGSDDLALPALAALAQAAESDRAVADELARSQRFDRAVSAAMHDVPLPAGLLDRLEARLAGESIGDSDDDQPLGTAVAAAASADSPPAGGRELRRLASDPAAARFSRRSVAIVLTSLAVVLLVAVGSILWPGSPRNINQDELASQASEWFQSSRQTAAWQSIKTNPIPAAYHVPAQFSWAAAWQEFTTPDGQSGIVVDLTRGTRGKARLFVIASHNKYDVAAIPFTRLENTTGNVEIAAWQRGGFLYVVAVEKLGQRLENFIQPTNLTHVLTPADRPAAPARPA